MSLTPVPAIFIYQKGKKQYELSNHLGNVMVTLSDRWTAVDDNADLMTDYCQPDVQSISDYYAFGSSTLSRNYTNGTEYRFGFNNQERDDEIQGEGNTNTAEFWQYDTRIGRRWNLDRVIKPDHSGYASLGNNPILYIDPNGNDWFMNNMGFYIWSNDASVMNQGFTVYVGATLPSGVSRYRILTFMEVNTNVGKLKLLYHKYYQDQTSVFFAWLFDCEDCVTNLKYSPHHEMFSEELFVTALGFGLAKITGAMASQALKMLKGAGGSLWKIAPAVDRGFVYEIARGGNLARNFPVIDKFVKGVATSIKTLDLKAPSYLKPNAVFNKLKGYIDKMVNFEGASFGGKTVTKEAYEAAEKVLDVAIPKGATKSQVEQIMKAREYASKMGIKLEINIVK